MKIISSFILLAFFFAFPVHSKAQSPAADSTNKILASYYSLKNSLVADDNKSAKLQAEELFTEIKNFPVDKLDAQQKKLWETYREKLEFDSRHISESGSLDHQREHFESLSKNMYQVADGLKLNSAVIYKQYCPMKKAMWLSETSAIKNPYYGRQMLTCGKTTDTIDPVR